MNSKYLVIFTLPSFAQWFVQILGSECTEKFIVYLPLVCFG